MQATKDRDVQIILDHTSRPLKVPSNYLKLKSEFDQTITPQLDKSPSQSYKAGDLVAFNQNKNVGYVLQV